MSDDKRLKSGLKGLAKDREAISQAMLGQETATEVGQLRKSTEILAETQEACPSFETPTRPVAENGRRRVIRKQEDNNGYESSLDRCLNLSK